MDETDEIAEIIASPSQEEVDFPNEIEEEIQDENLYNIDTDWRVAPSDIKGKEIANEDDEVLEDIVHPPIQPPRPKSQDSVVEESINQPESVEESTDYSNAVNVHSNIAIKGVDGGLENSNIESEEISGEVISNKVGQRDKLIEAAVVRDEKASNASKSDSVRKELDDQNVEVTDFSLGHTNYENHALGDNHNESNVTEHNHSTFDHSNNIREKRALAKQKLKKVPPSNLSDEINHVVKVTGADSPHNAENHHADSQILPNKSNVALNNVGGHAGKIRRIVKDHQRDYDGDGGGKATEWNDSLAAMPNASMKERHSIVEQRRKERIALRAQRLSGESAETPIIDSNVGVVDEKNSAEGAAGSSKYPVGSQPSRSRSYNAKHRVRRPVHIGSSEEGDPSRIVLPPLVSANQPKTSPSNHPRVALVSLLRESADMEDAMKNDSDNSSRNKRHRKPLYLRMIEKAQKQYLDDERVKHEKYVKERKLKQRSNPTAEELREHRRKHDLLVKAKLEEGRKNLAESVMNNARAVKRQQDVASVVQAAIESGGSAAELLVDGTSPLRKRRSPSKQSNITASGDIASSSSNAKEGQGGMGSNDSRRMRSKANVLEDHGFSPVKNQKKRNDEYGGDDSNKNGSRQQSPVVAISLSFGDKDNVSEEKKYHFDIHNKTDELEERVELDFDKDAAAAAVQKIPLLSSRAIPTYCAADWIDILTAVEIGRTSTDLMAVPFNLPTGGNKVAGADEAAKKGAVASIQVNEGAYKKVVDKGEIGGEGVGRERVGGVNNEEIGGEGVSEGIGEEGVVEEGVVEEGVVEEGVVEEGVGGEGAGEEGVGGEGVGEEGVGGEGVVEEGVVEEGVVEEGLVEEGVVEEGVVEEGVAEEGVGGEGVVEEGVVEEGVVEEGVVEEGVVEEGVVEEGVVEEGVAKEGVGEEGVGEKGEGVSEEEVDEELNHMP